jgi:hypothetical protein
MNAKFPEPKEVAYPTPTFHNRFRVVVQAADEKQAVRIANRISEFCSCSVEQFIAFTDRDNEEVLGEAIIRRGNFLPKTRTLCPVNT